MGGALGLAIYQLAFVIGAAFAALGAGLAGRMLRDGAFDAAAEPAERGLAREPAWADR
jgi:hypothetical protein